MKLDMKHAIKVSLILAAMAAVPALALAGLNLLTQPVIDANEVAKQEKALKSVFLGYENPIVSMNEKKEVQQGMVEAYWPVDPEGDGSLNGRAYLVSGRNGYGDVSLMIGLRNDQGSFPLCGLNILSNTETYGPVLEEEYLSKIQAWIGKAASGEASQDQVTAFVHDGVVCGATYGAKLCRDMIDGAVAHYASTAEGGQE